MPSFNAIAPDKLARLVGTRACPTIIDVRSAPGELLPGSILRRADDVAEWARSLAGAPVVVACGNGRELSAGVAALLRCEGIDAEILEDGVEGWRTAGAPLIEAGRLPHRDAGGRTLWVTRARPKVDRIACPWLIRRFVDPDAVFLFVAPAEVAGVAERFEATPFDVEGAAWSDRDGRCTFDALVSELGLGGFPALLGLAEIVRGADTGQLETTPQSPGLLAASLGLSRMHSDDLEQLADGMVLYDALYRWCRDATDETHDAPAHRATRGPR
jgi:rhodanese-related sulfurtransferase